MHFGILRVLEKRTCGPLFYLIPFLQRNVLVSNEERVFVIVRDYVHGGPYLL